MVEEEIHPVMRADTPPERPMSEGHEGHSSARRRSSTRSSGRLAKKQIRLKNQMRRSADQMRQQRRTSPIIKAGNIYLGNALSSQDTVESGGTRIEMTERKQGSPGTLHQDSMSSRDKATHYVGKGMRAVQGKGMRANAALRHQHVEQVLRDSGRSSVRLSSALSAPEANHTNTTSGKQMQHKHKQVQVVMDPNNATKTAMNEKFGKHGEVVYKQLMAVKEYKPRFTPIVTLIQCLVFGAACYLDGLLPWGVGYTSEMQDITRLNRQADLTQEVVTMHNMWLGPSTSTMIHWGAKFSPCMKASDHNIEEVAENTIRDEREYGCCYDSYQQCGQTTRATCERGMGATWTSAGQSCQAMLSNSSGSNCTEIVLRPCCHYVEGYCNVTTKAHCDLLLDPHVFHDDKELCGDVDCKPGICGMGTTEVQAWRFVTPIFMHVGVVHLMMNAIFQIRAVSDLEVVAGPWNTAKIYLLTGIGGNVCAALFSPKMPSAGASSSLYGVIAVQLVDLVQSWQLVQNKCWQAFTMLIQLALVLGIGTLPYVDNFAHVGGFLVGIFCGFAYLPYVYFSQSDRLRKACFHYSSRLALAGGMVALVGAFYLIKDPDFCSWCHYVNCVPYTDTMCDKVSSSA